MNLMTIMLQAEGAAAQGGGMTFWIMMIGIFVVMYFFMIRPQQKRQKEVQKFQQGLQKGQKVITQGGIYGTVKEVKEHYALVEIDNNVTIRVAKSMLVNDTSDLPAQK